MIDIVSCVFKLLFGALLVLSVSSCATMEGATAGTPESQLLPAKHMRHEINGTLGFGYNQADHIMERFVDDIAQRDDLTKATITTCIMNMKNNTKRISLMS